MSRPRVVVVGSSNTDMTVRAARLAVCAAAVSTERKGVQPSFPSRTEVEERFRNTPAS